VIGFGNTPSKKIEVLYTMIILESGFKLTPMNVSPLSPSLRPFSSLVDYSSPNLYPCPPITGITFFLLNLRHTIAYTSLGHNHKLYLHYALIKLGL
jgi:hypothetical protein